MRTSLDSICRCTCAVDLKIDVLVFSRLRNSGYSALSDMIYLWRHSFFFAVMKSEDTDEQLYVAAHRTQGCVCL
jgi:hypothetical protein